MSEPYNDREWWSTETLKNEATRLMATIGDLPDSSEEGKEGAEQAYHRSGELVNELEVEHDLAIQRMQDLRAELQKLESAHAEARVRVQQIERKVKEAKKDKIDAQRKHEAAQSSDGTRRRQLESRYSALMREIETREAVVR